MEDKTSLLDMWRIRNKVIDEFIQKSQFNALHYKKCLEWMSFEKFQNITYIAESGFGKIFSAEWSEGIITRNESLRNYLNKSENYIPYSAAIAAYSSIVPPCNSTSNSTGPINFIKKNINESSTSIVTRSKPPIINPTR
ncbi:unnamed protein product [Rhizophagus irregularis]|nr:unnamed protein product [Rhizophagus irregularis]